MTNFSSTYPNIAARTESYGWIEIGQDYDFQSSIRRLSMGGMVWEGKPKYTSQWTLPLMTWKRCSKKSLGRLGKISTSTRPPPNATWKLVMPTKHKLVAFGDIVPEALRVVGAEGGGALGDVKTIFQGV